MAARANCKRLLSHDFDLVEPSDPIGGSAVLISDWNFDSCDPTGWTAIDGRILNDGSNMWQINDVYSGSGGIAGKAAVLGHHDLCWDIVDGYGNDWDYSIVLNYSGTSTLSFDYLLDSEAGCDFMTVEADPFGNSEHLVNYITDPDLEPADFRTELFRDDGLEISGSVVSLALPNFGAGTHEVYIRFHSGETGSDEDGLYHTVLAAALVVDNITVTGGLTYSEAFAGALNPNVTLLNTAPADPFGNWARLYPGITDNDVCVDNTTCAWLFTDFTSPTTACEARFASAPGSFVVRNWLDQRLVSPWVSLASTPSAARTQLEYRIFPGNNFDDSRIVMNIAVRSKVRVDNTDTPAPGDSIDGVTPWKSSGLWHSLGAWTWLTEVEDLTSYVDSRSKEIQVRFRVADWQRLASAPAGTACGPGPFLDDVRIYRSVLTGPHIDPAPDLRSQAQDAFATVQNGITPGEHFDPDTGVFGSCAFSSAVDLAVASPNLITGDSIWVRVRDARNAGGITSVTFYGAIVDGPHMGKRPCASNPVVNEFFSVPAEQSRTPQGEVVPDTYFVDLDDTYFRGGDVLLYFWAAADAGGGFSSYPPGLSALPTSVAAAEGATGGLLEVSFLPKIDWDPAYLARIQSDPCGDLDPTPVEINGSQAPNQILYVQKVDPWRRSGLAHRTNFMFGLDNNSYSSHQYDVYDVLGFGNTNNDLGSRATVSQLSSSYGLIVYDTGRRRSQTIPRGLEHDYDKVDQAGAIHNYLWTGLASTPGCASAWLIGENVVEEIATNLLVTTDAGVSLAVRDATGPLTGPVSAQGVGPFTFTCSGNVEDFSSEDHPLTMLCSLTHSKPDMDGLQPSGSAVGTHRFKDGSGILHAFAVVMNKNNANGFNTIVSTFPWELIGLPLPPKATPGPDVPQAWTGDVLLNKILVSTVAGGSVLPTDTGPPDVETTRPFRIAPATPNPFAGSTAIEYSIPRGSTVSVTIFDVAGRRVRSLVTGAPTAPGTHVVTWDGSGAHGDRVASGLYVCRIDTDFGSRSRRLVFLR